MHSFRQFAQGKILLVTFIDDPVDIGHARCVTVSPLIAYFGIFHSEMLIHHIHQFVN